MKNAIETLSDYKFLQVNDLQADDGGMLDRELSAISSLDLTGPVAMGAAGELNFAASGMPFTANRDDTDLSALRSDFVIDNAAMASTTEAGVYSKIAINNEIGADGARALAAPFEAVVAIGSSAFGLYCSGTLIAPNVVLSARHCEVPSGDQVYFGEEAADAPIFSANVTSVELPDGPNFDFLNGGDVSILFLDTDVPAEIAEPMRLTTETDSLVGQVFTMVGYGLHGLGSTGGLDLNGQRWAGQNIIDAYGAPELTFGENTFSADFDDGTAFNNMIFGSDQTPLEFEAAPAQGDSGGPILVQNELGEYLIAGVLSGGTTPGGEYGDVSWWTSIEPFAENIAIAGGQIPLPLPDVDDHANSIDAVTQELEFEMVGSRFIARTDGFIGFGETSDETDYFKFSVSSPGKVIIDGRADSVLLDTTIELLDSNGDLIARNNDTTSPAATNATDSQLFIRELAVGEYFVAVTGNDDTTGGYRLAVRQPGAPLGIDDYGNSFTTASVIEMDAAGATFVNGSAEVGVDNDYIRFVAEESGQLVVRSRGRSGDLNTVLRGYDSNRNILDANNNFNGTLDSRLVFDVVEDQEYFLRLSSVGETTGDYRLSLRLKEPQVAAVGGGDKSIRLSLDDSHDLSPVTASSDQLLNDPSQYNDLQNGLLA